MYIQRTILGVELDFYQKWLLSQPPETILQNARKYADMSDIVTSLHDLMLSRDQEQTLPKMQVPNKRFALLEQLYDRIIKAGKDCRNPDQVSGELIKMIALWKSDKYAAAKREIAASKILQFYEKQNVNTVLYGECKLFFVQNHVRPKNLKSCTGISIETGVIIDLQHYSISETIEGQMMDQRHFVSLDSLLANLPDKQYLDELPDRQFDNDNTLLSKAMQRIACDISHFITDYFLRRRFTFSSMSQAASAMREPCLYFFVANTIYQKHNDVSFSEKNKLWAENYMRSLKDDGLPDNLGEYVMENIHCGLLDEFTTLLLKPV